MPIARSVSETYDSCPAADTTGRLGTFLMSLLYQCEVILCATFQSGQASNIIIAKFVQQNANKILLQKIMGKSAKSDNLPTE